jgi:hypothetical protein
MERTQEEKRQDTRSEIMVEKINEELINEELINEDKLVVPVNKETAKKKVSVELEVDTSVKDLGPNPFAWVIHLARAVDAWRIFPRIFITTYIYLLYKVVVWYMELPNPTMEQSGLVSIVVGAGAAWFGLYTGSRAKSSK